MDRRELLLAAGGTVLAAATGNVFAASSHHGHDHIKVVSKHSALAASASHCSATAEPCLNACFEVLATGDKSMASCAESVAELSSACNTLARFAANDSKNLRAMARVVRKVCLDCEEECLKHKDHEQCLTCAKACKECARLCKRYV